MKNLLTSLLVAMSFVAFGQSGTIRGTVFEDASGLSIIGGNISIKKSSDASFDNSITGTVTDLDGSFSFSLEPGSYDIQVSYVGYETLTITEIQVKAKEVVNLETIRMGEAVDELTEVVVTAKAIKTSEVALLTIKKKSAVMMDGISSAKFKLTGDATAVEAAKRVTGVSIEGGKYVYVRGLGDRYSKTTLNQVDIPGLDPDKNTIQMDIFPTNLIDNIIVSKNFTADMPADFTGGLLNIETKDFPDDKTFNVSVSTTVNPSMHFNSDYLTYDGGKTDFLGFDDGSRGLPALANQQNIPTPLNQNYSPQEVNDFVSSFNPELGASKETSLMDFSASISLGNQIELKGKESSKSSPKLGYIFSASYKSGYTYYDDFTYGEFQRSSGSENVEMVPAAVQKGQVGERSTLIGLLGGLAYKNNLSKYRLTAMRLQNGESRASQFEITDYDEAIGHSGFFATSDNLEYNERSLTNFLLNGTHVIGDSGWDVDWRLSSTISTSEDPDIRNTAFTRTATSVTFNSGAGGLPSRIWRFLDELNAVSKVDITKKYRFKDEDAKLKFGVSHTYKQREYKILQYGVQFFGSQAPWADADPNSVLVPANIYPSSQNNIYFASGNNTPNPNQYESNVNNTGFYVSNEFNLLPYLKTILGVRAENFVQRHTGRDQAYSNGDVNGRNLDNDKVLESLDFFPSANLIYSLTDEQNLRGSYSRTIARPSFKELSFAQILDPVSNRIFNGSLFPYNDWEGTLVETNIDNFDLRWELFQKGGQLFSISGFYKRFNNPIELVRIPQQMTSTEYQPRNVGDGQLFGIELEMRKDLSFLHSSLGNFDISTNVTFVESQIDMSNAEFQARKGFEKAGENIEMTRQMAGQSPYVINAGLSYTDSEAGLQAGLFYNVKGPTLFIVGGGLFPDIYTQPFHNVNFSIAKKIGAEKKTSIDLKVSNILGDRVESFYEAYEAQSQIFDSFNPGRAFSLGLSHQF
ncbi:MAG: TonB-dependent receptor [Saprospiraceae bacterium]